MNDFTNTPKGMSNRPGSSSSEEPKRTMPSPDFSAMEMPAAFREIADRAIAHAKDSFEKAKAAAGEATDALQRTYTAAAKGTTDYNLKVIEIARTNTNTAFDRAHEFLAVRSLSELVELSTVHARKQLEAMTDQTKELATLAQKLTSEIADPLKAGVSRTFSKLA